MKFIKIGLIILIIIAYPLVIHFLLLKYNSPFVWYFLLIQFVSFQSFLAIVFAYTLLPNKTPLLEYFAAFFHGKDMPKNLLRHCYFATFAWVMFFVMVVVVALAIFIWGDKESLSYFCNFLYFPLLLTMFACEYLVRIITLPNIAHATFLQGIKIYWKNRNSR